MGEGTRKAENSRAREREKEREKERKRERERDRERERGREGKKERRKATRETERETDRLRQRRGDATCAKNRGQIVATPAQDCKAQGVLLRPVRAQMLSTMLLRQGGLTPVPSRFLNF